MRLPGGVRVQNRGTKKQLQNLNAAITTQRDFIALMPTEAWQRKSHWKTTHEHFKQAKHCH